ncbi:ABC transporter permease [Nocardioides sp. SYSU DS0663]|uniref:ABC transporter permease n=1 Tax=Nocardioides sp. SYSU DS0663 TaxID=3416445 RepID=UPI003F4C3594
MAGKAWASPRAAAAVAAVLALAVTSLFVGVADLRPWHLLDGGPEGDAGRLLAVSRLPRTLAIVLTGMALGVVGLIMQMLSRNRFVEPSTAGTVEFAGLGILLATILAPAASLLTKMAVATLCALVGTAVFLRLLRAIPARSALVVPLVGLTLGGVVAAVCTFLAFRHDLLQSLGSWMNGDFSGVVRGRYELLWLVGALTVAAYVVADRFTVVGMGQELATNLGVDHGRVLALGLAIVSVTTAVTVVTVGAIPFLGLVVPNIAALIVGDNLRRSIPWVALLGAGMVLACDVVGRVVRQPYEIPVGTVVGVVGSVLFLYLLLRRPVPRVA